MLVPDFGRHPAIFRKVARNEIVIAFAASDLEGEFRADIPHTPAVRREPVWCEKFDPVVGLCVKEANFAALRFRGFVHIVHEKPEAFRAFVMLRHLRFFLHAFVIEENNIRREEYGGDFLKRGFARRARFLFKVADRLDMYVAAFGKFRLTPVEERAGGTALGGGNNLHFKSSVTAKIE